MLPLHKIARYRLDIKVPEQLRGCKLTMTRHAGINFSFGQMARFALLFITVAALFRAQLKSMGAIQV